MYGQRCMAGSNFVPVQGRKCRASHFYAQVSHSTYIPGASPVECISSNGTNTVMNLFEPVQNLRCKPSKRVLLTVLPLHRQILSYDRGFHVPATWYLPLARHHVNDLHSVCSFRRAHKLQLEQQNIKPYKIKNGKIPWWQGPELPQQTADSIASSPYPLRPCSPFHPDGRRPAGRHGAAPSRRQRPSTVGALFLAL